MMLAGRRRSGRPRTAEHPTPDIGFVHDLNGWTLILILYELDKEIDFNYHDYLFIYFLIS